MNGVMFNLNNPMVVQPPRRQLSLTLYYDGDSKLLSGRGNMRGIKRNESPC